MNIVSPIEHIEDIVSAPNGDSYLTIADAARRFGVSRSTLYRDIERGKIEATERGKGTRNIEIGELRRAYAHEKDEPETIELPGPSESEGQRLAALETEVLSLQARVRTIERQLGDRTVRAGDQPKEVLPLRPEQVSTQPATDPGSPEPSSDRYYSRKKRSKSRKLFARLRKFLAIFGLIVLTTGMVVGILYTIDRLNTNYGTSQTSRY